MPTADSLSPRRQRQMHDSYVIAVWCVLIGVVVLVVAAVGAVA